VAIYSPGTPVRAVVDGVETLLSPELVAADVTAAAGGKEAINGLPPGGPAGALLRKASGADGDATWSVGSGSATLGTTSDPTGSGAPRAAGYGTVLWAAPARPPMSVAGDFWIKP
jgi:hypothetical protein